MKFQYLKITIVFLILLLLAGCGGGDDDADEKAQSADSSQQESGMDDPIMDVLALVPDTAQNRLSVSYANYDAFVVESWLKPTADVIDFSGLELDAEQQAEFDSFLESHGLSLESNSSLEILQAFIHDEYSSFFTHAAISLSSGVSLQNFWRESLPGGVTIAMVNQSLEYGQPPENGEILAGNFDIETIKAAYEDRDYQAESLDGGGYRMCLNGDCSTGMEMNLEAREPAGIFGLKFGRSQPMLITPHFLASTADESVFDVMVASYADNQGSLADAADIQAIVETATSYGLIYQMLTFPATNSQWISATAILGERATDETVQELQDRLNADFEPFPPYSHIAFVHTADDVNEYALVILLYDNEADAQATAEAMPARIENYESLRMRRPFIGIINERADSWETTVFATTDYYAAVVVFSRALPGADASLIEELGLNPEDYGLSTPEEPAIGRPFALPYRLLADMYMARDTGWLAAELDSGN